MSTDAPLPKSAPTVRAIARRAGVSHTTVSLCLRNHPSIPEETRNRVRHIADEMGYRSNVLVSALMTQVRLRLHKSAPEVVAFLTGGPSPDEWKNHSASVGFFEGARRRAPALGMRVEAFWLGPGGAQAAATCRMLNARAIRGVLINPFAIPVYDYELKWSRLISVGLGYVYNNHPLHRATHNHFRGAFVAYQNLSKLGYRRIGLMLDEIQNSRVNYSWLGGYIAAQEMARHGRLSPLFTRGQEVDKVRSWVSDPQLDAVLGFGPEQLLALNAAGFTIPQDLAFAALDVEQARLAHVEEVSGINQNLPLVGATAIDVLAGLLYHNETGLPKHPVLSMIAGRWVKGRTAPPRRQ